MSAFWSCKLEILGLPRLQADVTHWRIRAKERTHWHGAVRDAMLEAGVKAPKVPLRHARLTFTRHSTTEPDPDNLAGNGFKPILDGIVRCRIIADDTREVIGTPTYFWRKAPRNQGRVTVEVTETAGAEVCPTCGR